MIINIEGEDIAVEDMLYKKLELMAKRITNNKNRQDACLQNSGNEGEGKTNSSIVEAAVIRKLTGRKINLFFSTQSALRFAQTNNDSLIIVDEPVLDALASDANTNNFKDLLRLTTTMRKKRHMIIFNFAKFWKFPEFLVVDRALGMVHVFSKGENDLGRFFYIRKKKLERLWNEYKKQGKRKYAKLKSFGGRMPYIMDRLFDKLDIRVEDVEHARLKDYDNYKDRAIESIGVKKEKKDKNLLKLNELRKKIASINFERLGITQGKLAGELGINSGRLREWKNLVENEPLSLEKVDFESSPEANSVITMAEEEENSPDEEEEGEDAL